MAHFSEVIVGAYRAADNDLEMDRRAAEDGGGRVAGKQTVNDKQE